MFINFDFTCEYRVLSNTYLMGQGGVLFFGGFTLCRRLFLEKEKRERNTKNLTPENV
jgi:hypothetical protein